MLEPWGRGERRVISVTEKGWEERKTPGDTAEMDKWRGRGPIKEKGGKEAKGQRRKKGPNRSGWGGG